MGVAVALSLAAVAWFGHAFLLTVWLNVWFSLALRRWFLKRMRVLVALLVFAFPLILAWTCGRDLLGFWGDPSALTHRWFVFGYLCVCWFTSLVFLPIITVHRMLRRYSPQVEVRHSRVEDIARRLGEKPIGNGKYWRLARLPGTQCFQTEFRDIVIRLPRLPTALDGLTILQLTDMHFCGTPGREYYREVFDIALSAGRPDILAITGDVVDSHHHYKWIVPLIGRLKWNVAAFAVLGNHDLYHDPTLVRRRLRRTGVNVIGNGCEQIVVRGTPITVVGNEMPWFQPAPVLPPVIDPEPNMPFRLCLSHTPDNFKWARRNRIDLMLAGHVHGGQVRIPLLGPLFVPSRYSRRYDCGAFAAGPTVMYVGRGLAGGEPLRYNCRPEVTRIILKRKAAT